ncbi:hypothetical protein OsJ_21195 [Oryza sativa Japonica Group]|uniref:Uncharacterized protein n=1 Tax=Oryza sativa subsp. japonica TaxID=39947 RepID=B9FT18_ORYSJ|nr:hypothetical protein OsJ_21195 [Oryza sativa Japonica Group]
MAHLLAGVRDDEDERLKVANIALEVFDKNTSPESESDACCRTHWELSASHTHKHSGKPIVFAGTIAAATLSPSSLKVFDKHSAPKSESGAYCRAHWELSVLYRLAHQQAQLQNYRSSYFVALKVFDKHSAPKSESGAYYHAH